MRTASTETMRVSVVKKCGWYIEADFVLQSG